MNKHTIKGLAYSTISVLGLGYEIIFIQPPRAFLLIMYSLVAIFSVFYIFKLKNPTDDIF